MLRRASGILAMVLTLGLVPAIVLAEPSGQSFRAHLSGDEEVPPVDTDATGQVKFKLNKAGDELAFKLIVANIENVVAAHIHCRASEGVNAGVAVTLFGPVAPGGGPSDGVLAQGTVDPAATCPNGGGTVLQAMRDGQAYVNVHTDNGEAPQNTGPGDMATGEIRGQVDAGGPKP